MSEQTVNMQVMQPLWATLGERASRDEAFRQRLVREPKKVLSEMTGEPIPANVKVVAHEDSPTNLNVVLEPAALAMLDKLPDGGGPIAQAVKRAHNDPAFRKSLEQDPKRTVLEATGIEIPDNLRISFHENSPNEIHLIVPPLASAEGELSDAELEAVAGGRRRRTVCRNVGVGTGAVCTGVSFFFPIAGAISGGVGGVVGAVSG